MKEIDRRTALKMEGAVLAEFVAGEVMMPLKKRVNDVVEEVSGHPTGNAWVRARTESDCKGDTNKQECSQQFSFSTAEKVELIAIAPITEEITFRAIPSGALSTLNNREDPYQDVMFGSGEIGMTRCEFIFGMSSAVIFGALHNITDKGIDTETIPASQVFGGVIYWYLQRKLGIIANTVAHSLTNFHTVTRMSKK